MTYKEIERTEFYYCIYNCKPHNNIKHYSYSKNDLPSDINIYSVGGILSDYYFLWYVGVNTHRDNDLPSFYNHQEIKYYKHDNRYRYNGYSIIDDDKRYNFHNGICLKLLSESLNKDDT